MSNESCVSIEILKEIPLEGEGEGDTLVSRLRKVSLRGFPDVKIYENASFEVLRLNSEEIRRKLHRPEVNVYQTHLDRISVLFYLFKEKGINILNLENAYDFYATSKSGEVTTWTMLLPIVEHVKIPRTSSGAVDYKPLMGELLQKRMQEVGATLAPELDGFMHSREDGVYNLINDGSQRVHFGFLNGGIKVLRIKGMTPGFPYYAAPQPYSNVNLLPKEDIDLPETKVHIITAPYHKDLYRLFPSGGIMSGVVRPDKKLVD